MPKDLQCLAQIQEKTEFTFLLHRSIDSTNSEAKRLAERSCPEWTVVIADAQRSGRGRHGRSWLSPEGVNIYMSIILRPSARTFHYNLIGLAAGLSVLEAVRETLKGTKKELYCKWPNDVLFNSKKISGVLSEAGFKGSRPDYIVVGVGVNVNMTREQIPLELRGAATSLAIETGERYNRGLLIKEILGNFRGYYSMLETDSTLIVKRWSENSLTISSRVRAYTHEGVIEGVAEAIDERGFLVIHTDGGMRKVSSADIIHLR